MIADLEPVESGLPMPLPPHVANALPDLLLGAYCLVAWIAPTRLPAGAIRGILLMMLVEFIVVHTSAFMGMQLFVPGSRRVRASALLGFGLLYSVFAGGFALAFHTWWPVVSFWLLTLNRLSGVLFRQAPSGQEQRFVQAGWAASAMCYLGGVFVTLAPGLPRLGVTPDVIASLHLTGRGVWVDEPWRVVAFGALYFGAVGAFEWTGFRAFQARTPATADAGASAAAPRG